MLVLGSVYIYISLSLVILELFTNPTQNTDTIPHHFPSFEDDPTKKTVMAKIRILHYPIWCIFLKLKISCSFHGFLEFFGYQKSTRFSVREARLNLP